MNICGTTFLKDGYKMVLELGLAPGFSIAGSIFIAPPQPMNFLRQIQNGLLDAIPSKCDVNQQHPAQVQFDSWYSWSVAFRCYGAAALVAVEADYQKKLS